MSDGELLDQIATYGLDMESSDLTECLRLADCVFRTGRLGKADRKWADALLAKLSKSSAPAAPKE